MKRYEKYKDSGVEWLGMVPEHWDVCRFKNFMTLVTNSSDSDMKIGLENLESGTGRYIETNAEFEGNGVGFEKADIVYGKLRPYLQKVWLAEFDGNAIGDFFIFRAKPNSYPSFIKYLLLSDGVTKEANGSTFGAKMPRVSSEFILTLPFYLPTIDEQLSIADYLDAKCAKIDKVIATQEKRVELLKELKQSIITHAVTRGINPGVKLKDSGVEWIGMIPEHWEVKKLNSICKEITDFVASGSFADLRRNVQYLDEPDYAMLVRTADLSQKNRDIQPVYVSKSSYEFLSNSNLFGGEIILPNIGASIGNVYMVPDDLYEKMTLGPNAILMRTKYIDKFFYYYFMSKGGSDSLILMGQAAAQNKFNKTELRQMKAPIPPLKEQLEIVTYIEQQTSKLDSSMSKALRQIELLKEYKQSLITEVVTGKRKVC